MPKFVIERHIPGAGTMSPQEMQMAALKSCEVLQDLGPQVQWVHSYVSDDRIHCVYIAPDERAIRAHAEKSGFPANRIMQVKAIMDPTTAEMQGSLA